MDDRKPTKKQRSIHNDILKYKVYELQFEYGTFATIHIASTFQFIQL